MGAESDHVVSEVPGEKRQPEHTFTNHLNYHTMQIHILNGDALTDRMQSAGFTNLYVCREAMIDGPLRADTPQQFWEARGHFLEDAEDYNEMVVAEFEKLKNIPADADIHLWFGDDLFCQANMWFIIDYLYSLNLHNHVYRIFPLVKKGRWDDYAFHTPEDFQTCHNNRLAFTPDDIQLGLNLWTAYSNNDLDTLQSLSHTKSSCFRWLDEVVQAHVERSTIHRPEQTLKTIIANGATDFGTIFRSFYTTEGIYGFGDTQVKKLLDNVLPTRHP